MSPALDMGKVESKAYRSRFDDGLVDLFIGLSALWIGACWVWFDDLAGLAGLLPAILVAPFISFRTRFIDHRAGYVRFSEQRRSWERRNLILLLLGGLATFALGIGAFVAFNEGGTLSEFISTIAPGLIAFLLAIAVLLIAVAAMLPRGFVYAGVLFVGGVWAVVQKTNPGVPLLIAGVVIFVWGSVLLVRFMSLHPSTDAG